MFGGSLDKFLFALIQECHLLGKLLRCWEVNLNTGGISFYFSVFKPLDNPKTKSDLFMTVHIMQTLTVHGCDEYTHSFFPPNILYPLSMY